MLPFLAHTQTPHQANKDLEEDGTRMPQSLPPSHSPPTRIHGNPGKARKSEMQENIGTTSSVVPAAVK